MERLIHAYPFTNDDGVFSPGLLALLSAFQGDGNELLVAAPDAERSGASHSFTMLSPLRAKPVMIPGAERVAAYAVSGTPVDCVKLAYGNLLKTRPADFRDQPWCKPRYGHILLRYGFRSDGGRVAWYSFDCGIQYCVEAREL